MSDNEEIIVNEEVVEKSVNKGSAISDKITNFINENKSSIIKWAVIPVAIIGLLVAWRVWWLPQRNDEANKELAKLYHYYDSDSMDFVLKGGKGLVSAPKIASSYWLTQKGKEAALMAATAYLKTGDYKNALKYFGKCKSKDETTAASILAGKAHCYSEMKETKKAAEYYLKAAEKGDNEFTAPYYKTAGIHFEMAGEYSKAIKAYTSLKEKYPNSRMQEVSDIDRYIYKAKALNGDLD